MTTRKKATSTTANLPAVTTRGGRTFIQDMQDGTTALKETADLGFSIQDRLSERGNRYLVFIKDQQSASYKKAADFIDDAGKSGKLTPAEAAKAQIELAESETRSSIEAVKACSDAKVKESVCIRNILLSIGVALGGAGLLTWAASSGRGSDR